MTSNSTCRPGYWDVNLCDFPRAAGETSDSKRIMRAACAAGDGGVLFIPRGDYEIDETVNVSGRVSFLLHKSARLFAVKELDFIFVLNPRKDPHDYSDDDFGIFVRGGIFDGAGLASCALVYGRSHLTLCDTLFKNGKNVGLQLGDDADRGGYEIFGYNLYFKCDIPGMAGNTGFRTYVGDSHFTDFVVVDYTIGIQDLRWSNRFTRCHVWGGIVNKEGTNEPEMLPGSVAFDLASADAVLTDCYADTAMTGYLLRGSAARIFQCAYYNNWRFKMDNPVVFDHRSGTLAVIGGRFSKNSPNATLFSSSPDAGSLIWRDNLVLNFTIEETAALKKVIGNDGETLQSEKSSAKLSQ